VTKAGVIETTHGVVAGHDAKLFTHRNLLDAEKLAHLLERHPPYVSIVDALRGKGNAFTIDDSTVAAADAARLARSHGHAVTLFVNGYNVTANEPYFFSRMALALDTATADQVMFDGTRYALTSMTAKEDFRSVVKRHLARIGSEEQRQSFVREFAELIGGNIDDVPAHLKPLTLRELEALRDYGVDLQNHGWTHVRVGALDADAHAADIGQNREWMRRKLDVDAYIFAVPNGDGFPLWPSSPHYSIWLLLDGSRPYGEVAPGVHNRLDLDF
jgi:hypothetical protein